MKLDFEFVSTHRNRNLWPSPCLFEVPWSGSGQLNGLNSLDPTSLQAPIVAWTGQNINTAVTVVSQTNNTLIVSAPTLSQLPNYYQGAELSVPPSFRIDESKFIGSSGGLDYTLLNVVGSGVTVGAAIQIRTTAVPNTLFVPGGSDLPNSYVGKYLYNETLGQWVSILGYNTQFHTIVANIPPLWLATHNYCIREQLPSLGNFTVVGGTTATLLDLTNIPIVPNPGDFIRVLSTGEISKIVAFDTTTFAATVSPALSATLANTDVVEVLSQSTDNYRTLSYTGTVVGQQEQVAYDINLVSATIPNTLLKNGGYPVDYPFFYIELYDTNHPSQTNIFSNNHSNKSYFKVTTPTGQLAKRDEKFTKFTGDLSHKTIRFRPTSNFRVVWRFPSGQVVQFEQQDTQSPNQPNEFLQTSILFNLTR